MSRCVGGPFIPRRLSYRVGTLLGLGKNLVEHGISGYVGVNGRALSPRRSYLGSRTKVVYLGLGGRRAGALRLLTGGGGVVVGQRVVRGAL